MQHNHSGLLTAARIALVILAFSFTGGCSSSSSPSNNNTTAPTVVIPNVGTNWKYYFALTDTTGHTYSIGDTVTRVIAATNYEYQGFNDVVMIVETYKRAGIMDTSYIRYLSTGDISRATDASFLPEFKTWFTIPYYTHALQLAPLGTTASGVHDTATFSSSWLRQETETAGGVAYQASVISSAIWQHLTSAGKDSTFNLAVTAAFIPQYGIYGDNATTSETIDGTRKDIGKWTLVGVTIK